MAGLPDERAGVVHSYAGWGLSSVERLRSVGASAILLIVALSGLTVARFYSYPLFHTLAELFAIVIGCAIFVLAWNARHLHRAGWLTVLGVGLLAASVLSLAHTVVYPDLGLLKLSEEQVRNMSVGLFTSARLVAVGSMVAAALIWTRPVHGRVVLALYTTLTTLLLMAVFYWEVFPHSLRFPGLEYTWFKVGAEWASAALYLLAAALFWQKRQQLDREVLLVLTGAFALGFLGSALFTFYVPRDTIIPWFVHTLRLVEFALIYQAIIVTALERPYSLLFRDLTQSEQAMRRATAEARAANRAKDQFLAVLSHELRTPLNPVLALVSDLSRQPRLSPDLRQDMDMIRRNIELEARLIDDLLDLTRISSGKLLVEPKPVELHELLGQTAEVCRTDAQSKGVRLELELAAPQTWVQADPARLTQVFWNLVKNAVKFSPDDSAVTVRTVNLDPGSIRADVIDRGIGIDAERLARVFDPFYQTSDEHRRRFGGLGLGLAIGRALVELQGGSIAAHSEGPGKGAMFSVTLPTITAPSRIVAPAESSAGTRRSMRLLLVEDHGDTALIMARLLRARAHDVTAVGTVADALGAADKQPFDLVISDIGLPDGSGLDLMRELRDRHGLKGVALSGYGSESDLAASRQAGFIEHVTKPIDFSRLEAVLDRFV
jgi:signal transduction histidine kinase/CheY-like chemotaxis protein